MMVTAQHEILRQSGGPGNIRTNPKTLTTEAQGWVWRFQQISTDEVMERSEACMEADNTEPPKQGVSLRGLFWGKKGDRAL